MMDESKILSFTDKLILRFYQDHYRKQHPGYHPVPWLGISQGTRSTGSYQRLNALLEFLKISKIKEGTVLDVGCNVGFFSLSLKEKGFCVYGVENKRFSLTVANILAHSLKKGNFFPINMSIDEKTVEYLPSADICLCLSIWHHWVIKYGLKDATIILRSLFKKTNRVLFFDAAKPETRNNFSVNEYLARTLSPKHILLLGEYSARESEKNGTLTRELYAIIK